MLVQRLLRHLTRRYPGKNGVRDDEVENVIVNEMDERLQAALVKNAQSHESLDFYLELLDVESPELHSQELTKRLWDQMTFPSIPHVAVLGCDGDRQEGCHSSPDFLCMAVAPGFGGKLFLGGRRQIGVIHSTADPDIPAYMTRHDLGEKEPVTAGIIGMVVFPSKVDPKITHVYLRWTDAHWSQYAWNDETGTFTQLVSVKGYSNLSNRWLSIEKPASVRPALTDGLQYGLFGITSVMRRANTGVEIMQMCLKDIMEPHEEGPIRPRPAYILDPARFGLGDDITHHIDSGFCVSKDSCAFFIDGRKLYLNNFRAGTYDIIVMDCFMSRVTAIQFITDAHLLVGFENGIMVVYRYPYPEVFMMDEEGKRRKTVINEHIFEIDTGLSYVRSIHSSETGKCAVISRSGHLQIYSVDTGDDEGDPLFIDIQQIRVIDLVFLVKHVNPGMVTRTKSPIQTFFFLGSGGRDAFETESTNERIPRDVVVLSADRIFYYNMHFRLLCIWSFGKTL